MEHYNNKPKGYFNHARHDLISMIPKSSYSRVLEIGAGGGDTLLEIKRQKIADKIYGIELMQLPGSRQQSNSFEKFLIGDIEKMAMPFDDGYFDLIICGDVLEHLVDPWKMTEKISRLLKKGGLFLTSIPNIRVKSALVKIFLNGSFAYTSEGTFDRTHLRFFCKKDMIALVEVHGLQIEAIRRSFDFNPGSKGQILNRLTFNIFEEFLALQFLFRLRKL